MGRSGTVSKRERRATEMRRTLEAFESSGMSRAAFCRSRGVPMSTFLYWRRRLALAAGAGDRFVEVEVADVVGAEERVRAIEIASPGGVVVRLAYDADESLIRRVLRAAAPC